MLESHHQHFSLYVHLDATATATTTTAVTGAAAFSKMENYISFFFIEISKREK